MYYTLGNAEIYCKHCDMKSDRKRELSIVNNYLPGCDNAEWF